MIDTMTLRIPRELNEWYRCKAKEVGIPKNALLLRALWNLCEQSKQAQLGQKEK